MKSLEEALAEIDKLTVRNPGLRLTWIIKAYKPLSRAIVDGKGDELLATMLETIRSDLAEHAAIKRPRKPRKLKPPRPGPGYARERLDVLRAQAGLPPSKPRRYPWR